MNDEIQKRCNYFFKEKATVHIKLINGAFYNGIILEISEEEFIIFIDRYSGELPIFFTEIARVERFTE